MILRFFLDYSDKDFLGSGGLTAILIEGLGFRVHGSGFRAGA